MNGVVIILILCYIEAAEVDVLLRSKSILHYNRERRDVL